MKLKKLIEPYFRSIPRLLFFRFITSVVISLAIEGLSQLSKLLLGSAGKATVSSGDYMFLFTGWQGWLLILVGLSIVLFYMAIDVNALIIFCSKLLNGEKPLVFKCIFEGIKSIKKYLNYRAVFVIIYIALLAPLLKLGFTVRLTESFYIPDFISSVIYNNPLYAIGLAVITVLLAGVYLIYSFIMHGTLLTDKSMKEASVESRKIFKANWKNYIFELFRFSLLILAMYSLVLLVFMVIPLFIIHFIPSGSHWGLFAQILLTLFGLSCVYFTQLVFSPFYVMKVTQLYRKYTTNGEWEYTKPKKGKAKVITAAAVYLAFIAVLSLPSAYFFDDIFPSQVKTNIVAHRAGGNEAPENTVAGVNKAYELGAFGSETDIQRTSDGYYVINHDNDFSRVAGVNKKPSEMTLAEVKKLRVDGEPVPTLEEMLDASKDKVTLLVELKGETADEQMADDAVRIIKEKGMADQTVLISLKYDVLDYIEQKYPEMQTGYLAFFSFGNIEKLPFDYLALEEEISTDAAIDAIHENNKKIMVWTVNKSGDIENFLTSDADAIITDEVKTSKEIEEKLENRSVPELIYERINMWFFKR